MTRRTVFLKALAGVLAVLCLCAFMGVPAAHAQEARIEKAYKGTLTGSIQHHPENKAFPYWLKAGNSTYAVALGHDKDQKALLDEFLGTRMSLTGTIREFADGSLAIVLDQPIKRPEPNPALAIVKKAMAKDGKNSVILEEFLLGNGWDVFLLGIRTKGSESIWYYRLYSVKWNVLTMADTSKDGWFEHYDDVVMNSVNSDSLYLSCPKHDSGKGLMELSFYKNERIYGRDDIALDKEHCSKDTITGYIIKNSYAGKETNGPQNNDKLYLKSDDSVYEIRYPYMNNETANWCSGRVGKRTVLTGKVCSSGADLEIVPDPVQPEQPEASVTVSGKSVLHNGKPVFTAPEVAAVFLREELILGNGEDIYLVGMASDTADRPYLFKIFSVKNGVCTATDAFGNGKSKPWLYPAAVDAANVTFGRFNPGKGYTETWTYKGGAVSKAQAEASIPTSPSGPDLAALAKTPESVGLNFAKGKHPIDTDLLEECMGPDGGSTVHIRKCLTRQLAAWRNEVDTAYEALMAQTETQEDKDALKLAQEQWCNFAMAQGEYICKAVFSQETGTVGVLMCVAEVAHLYRQRAIQLFCAARMGCSECSGGEHCTTQ